MKNLNIPQFDRNTYYVLMLSKPKRTEFKIKNLCFMARALVVLIFIALTQLTYGQSSIALKLAPTSLINPIHPSIHVAVDIELDEKLHVQPEFGFILKHHLLDTSNNTFGWRDFYSENKGYFLKLEFRPKNLIIKDPWYLGIQLLYLRNDYIRRGDRFDATPEQTPVNVFCSTCVVEDEYRISKTQQGFKVTFGYQNVLFSKLVVDAYFGIGLTLQNNVHSKNSELHMNPAIADRYQFGLFPRPNYYMPHYPGLTLAPYLGFLPGIKLGYLLKE